MTALRHLLRVVATLAAVGLLAGLLSLLLTQPTTGLVLAAIGLLAAAGALVLALPLLDRVPAQPRRPHPATLARASMPRQPHPGHDRPSYAGLSRG